MEKLIITAHPSSKGFTHKIAKTYFEESKEQGHNIEIVDLYNKKYELDFLRFENKKEIKVSNTAKILQKKIAKAKEIVFVFPTWWGDGPAILKNFLDNTLTSGFAFEYEDGKPTKLLNIS